MMNSVGYEQSEPYPLDVDIAENVITTKPETLHASLPKLAKRIVSNNSINSTSVSSNNVPPTPRVSVSRNRPSVKMVDAIDEVSGRQVRRVSVDYGSGGDNTGEHPPGSVSPGGTPMVPQVSGAAATVESLRTADMKYDDNSAVEYAMSKANKRLSVTRLKATGGLPHTHKDKNDIPHKPKSKRKEKAKNAEGRLITQGHEQYALTYGMMLGIRVSTGRNDVHSNGRPNDGGRNMFTLTDSDYHTTTKLVFPPEGSKGTKEGGFLPTPAHKLNFPFKFKDYCPNVFRAIRALSGIQEEDYIMSLAGDFNYIEFIANSKSGQFFFYSHDGKYMIKTQTKEECILLREIMPQYIAHLIDNPDSLLVRFYGMHRVKMSALGREIHFVIMSSVFDTEKPIHVKYDLKGSTVGRITKPEACEKGAVQKDCNLMESGRTLYFGEMVETLRETLVSDSNFLAKLMIMDYSLLVGVHDMRSRKVGRRHSSVIKPGGNVDGTVTMLDDQHEVPEPVSAPMTKFQAYEGGVRSAEGTYEIYYIGIIDILQFYNSRKRAETFFRGFQHDAKQVSAVHPQWYAERFVKFLMAHTDYEEEMQRKAEMQMVPSGEVEILPVVEESEEGREVEEVREVESVKSNVEDSEVFEEAQQNLEMTSLNVNLSNENSTLRPHTVEDIDVQEKIALATTDVAVEQQRKVVPCTASSAVNADDLPPPVRPVRTNRDASIKRSNSTPMPTTTDKAIDTQVMPPGPVPNSQQSPTRLSPGPPLQIGGQTRSTLFQKIQEKQAALERQQSGSQSAKISTANNSSRALIRQAIERSSSQKLNGSGSRDVGNGAPSPNSSATLSPSGRLTLYQKIQKKQSILQAQQSPSANTIAGVNGNPPIIRRQLSGGMKPTRVVNQESGRYA